MSSEEWKRSWEKSNEHTDHVPNYLEAFDGISPVITIRQEGAFLGEMVCERLVGDSEHVTGHA